VRVSFKIFWVILIFALLLSGCENISPKPPELSELQIREIQTRHYENVSYEEAIKAVIASLQDQEFIITNVNEKLGLVTAYKDIEAIDIWEQFGYSLSGGKGTYQTTKRTEANVTVRKESNFIKIRVTLVEKGITLHGGIKWTKPIYDPEAYQKIFSKIDKALFIEKEKI